MDDDWIRRLHVRPEASAFASYAKTLRLLSGLNEVGLLRALAKAKGHRQNEERERELRTDPAVVSFVRSLESVPQKDLPVVLAVITEGLFPKGTSGWFSAGSPDPLVSPSAAASHVFSRVNNAIESLSPLVGPMDPAPRAGWSTDVRPTTEWAQEVIQTFVSKDVLEMAKVTTSSTTPMAIPAEEVRKTKVELFAEGKKLSFERFYLHQKACGAHLLQAIEKGFSGCLVGVHGTLFERQHHRDVKPDVVLAESLPDVTLFEYQVSWKSLVGKNGIARLASVFDIPEELSRIDETLKDTLDVPIDVTVDEQTLLTQDLTVPRVAKVGDIRQAFVSAYGDFFDGVRTTVRLRTGGDPLDDHLSLAQLCSGPSHLVFQISLQDLIECHGKQKVLETFPALVLNEDGPTTMERETSCFINVKVIAEGCYTLCERRFLVPFDRSSDDGTADALVQRIRSTFGTVFAPGKGFLTTTDGGRIRGNTVLANRFPDQDTFSYHVELTDLLISTSPQGLRQLFPDAECLRFPSRYPEVEAILDRHCKIYGQHQAVLTEVGLSESVPLQIKETTGVAEGQGTQTGEAQPTPLTGDLEASEASRSSHRGDVPAVEPEFVVQARLLLDSTLLFLRYEKVFAGTTAKDVCDNLMKFVPEKYKGLQARVHIAGSNELLEKSAKLVEVLRPIEMTLDVVLDVSKLDKTQISLAIGVLRTALSPFDASTARTLRRLLRNRSPHVLDTCVLPHHLEVPGMSPSCKKIPVLVLFLLSPDLFSVVPTDAMVDQRELGCKVATKVLLRRRLPNLMLWWCLLLIGCQLWQSIKMIGLKTLLTILLVFYERRRPSQPLSSSRWKGKIP